MQREALQDALDEVLLGRGAGTLHVTCAGSEAEVARGASPRDRFPLYSVTKTVIATLLLQQVDEGKAGLDDPLAAWHPDVPGSDRCTLRQVLQHRAGLRDYGPLASYHEALRGSPSHAWTRERYLEETVGRGLAAEPGSRFAYSNPGYRLLREVVERLAGASFAACVRARIAEPLDLPGLRVLEGNADYAALVAATSSRLSTSGALRDVGTAMDPEWVFHGTVGARAREVSLFLRALADGRLVSKSSFAAMTDLVPVGEVHALGPEPSYGLGLMGDPTVAGGLFGHDGGGPGWTATAFHAPRHPQGALTIVALCAVEEPPVANALVPRVLEILDAS